MARLDGVTIDQWQYYPKSKKLVLNYWLILASIITYAFMITACTLLHEIFATRSFRDFTMRVFRDT